MDRKITVPEILKRKNGGDPIVRRCRVGRNRGQGITVTGTGGATVEDCDLTRNRGGSWKIDPGA